MAINPARYDFRDMSPLQADLHTSKKDEFGASAATPFASQFHPSFRNSSMRINLTRVATNGSSVDYVVKTSVDYLLFTYLEQKLPAVAVAPEHRDRVQIAWTHYLGINLFHSATLQYGDVQISKLTPMAMFVWMLFLLQQGRLAALFEQIGHTSDLTEWADALPASQLYVPLPWYYSHHQSFALPFVLLRDKRELIHRFHFAGLKELLRMRVRSSATSDDWQEVPVDLQYLTLTEKASEELPVPELFARGVMIEEEELNHLRCNDEVVFYYDTFQFLESTPETPEGQECTISLDCEAPCKVFAFGCTTMRAKETNQYQNWLAPTGEPAVKAYRITYGNNERVPTTTLEHAAMDMWELMPPNCDTRGLAVHLNDIMPNSLAACSGVVYSPQRKAELHMQLRKTADSTVTYKGQVLLWITQKLVFQRDKNDSLVYNINVHPDPITGM
jgi:hypothetical protein